MDEEATPVRRLEKLAQEAVAVAKKAQKHKQSLSGRGFYAKKLAELRIRATNTFTDLKATTPGDTSALAELTASVFSATTQSKIRSDSERELTFALRTTWRDSAHQNVAIIQGGIFPLPLLEQTKRGYLIMIGRQINGCFKENYFDACAVMMRRLLEVSIIEAFEAKGIADNIQSPNGNYFQLSELITKTLSETSFTMSRNTKRALPNLRDNGHLSAHGRSYFAQRTDLERILSDFRIAVEELLHISDLL